MDLINENSDNEKSINDSFLNMTDEDIDNLLMGVDIETTEESVENNCISCGSSNIVMDENNSCNVCKDYGVINKTFLDKNPSFNKDDISSSYGCPTNPFFPKSAMGTKINFKGYNRLSLIQRQGQMPYKEKSL